MGIGRAYAERDKMVEMNQEKSAVFSHIFLRVADKTGLDVETIQKAIFDEVEEVTCDGRK